MIDNDAVKELISKIKYKKGWSFNYIGNNGLQLFVKVTYPNSFLYYDHYMIPIDVDAIALSENPDEVILKTIYNKLQIYERNSCKAAFKVSGYDTTKIIEDPYL